MSKPKRKKSKWLLVFSVLFLVLDALISFFLRLYDRKQVIRILEKENEEKAIYIAEKTQKTP